MAAGDQAEILTAQKFLLSTSVGGTDSYLPLLFHMRTYHLKEKDQQIQ